MKIYHILNSFLNKRGQKKFSKISYWDTILFNLRAFPLKIAIRLPVALYNKTMVTNLGNVSIEEPITRGMIKIGIWPVKSYSVTKISISGNIHFKGKCWICGGTILEGKGDYSFGNQVKIGENCKMMCKQRIEINDFVAIGYDSIIMDTDFHFVIDTETGRARRNTKSVIIESNTWISSIVKY